MTFLIDAQLPRRLAYLYTIAVVMVLKSFLVSNPCRSCLKNPFLYTIPVVPV